MAKSKKPPRAPKPKVMPPADQKEQSERFLAAVQDLVDAGELNPTDAEERFEGAMRKLAPDNVSYAKKAPSND